MNVEEENIRLKTCLLRVCGAVGEVMRTRVLSSKFQQIEDVSESLCSIITELKIDLDEADRRAGEAERMLAQAQDSKIKRDLWLSKAKADWGVSDNVSFDTVWEEALKLKLDSLRRD